MARMCQRLRCWYCFILIILNWKKRCTNNIASMGVSKSNKSKAKPVSINSDAAKAARNLLDTIYEAKNVADALADFTNKRKNTLPNNDVKELQLMVDALNGIFDQGRHQTAKVSKVPYVHRAYEKYKSDKDKKEGEYTGRLSKSIRKLKQFVGSIPDKKKNKSSAASPPPVPQPPAAKKARSSERTVVSPDKPNDEVAKILALKGQPQFPDTKWTKESLINALIKLEGSRKSNAFISAVVDVGKTDYKDPSSIYRMYNQYKKNLVVPGGRGRKSLMNLDEVTDTIKTTLKECASDSNTFKLSHMKDCYEQKKKEQAEKDGLDPDSTNCNVSDVTAKVAIVAAAMSRDDLTLSDKNLQTKTLARWIAEHSIMGGYAYAATVLSTHFIEGDRRWANYNPDNLGTDALETMEWMKKVMNADKIFPVNPNLVLSTDDTSLFVFEGQSNNNNDWDWKIIDKTNGNSSVRSDFEVGDDAGNNGGLRVRLTFTFTASGLAAPPYVAVSGLTESELSVEKCPDGLLAAEIPGLCKGGDDIFNMGIGWLVFLRADKKDKSEDKEEATLSIANKKFLHYNVSIQYVYSLLYV